MKFFIALMCVLSFSAQASLYSEFSRVYVSEIECLDSAPSEIECEEIQNNLMMCKSEFDALMKNAGVKKINVTIYENIHRDSKIFRPFTDKLNAFSAKSTAKNQVKEKLKNLKEIKLCE